MYDHYVSLGDNCEVSFQMRRVLGRDESSFFGWNVTTPSALITLLKSKFVGIQKAENIRHHVSNLFTDVAYDYKFHSTLPQGEGTDYTQYPEQVEEQQSKAQYLVSKLYENAQSDRKTAYFYKLTDVIEPEKARAFAEELLSELEALHEGRNNFVFVLLQRLNDNMDDWGLARIKNRYLKRIAPFDDATDGHVQSWDRVFREFPHKDSMRLAGF